jgi:hypothetical protein
MSAPPWGHKPPPMDDSYLYWVEQPPEPSARCEYWLRRYREGTWKPNKWLTRECNQCRAGWLGVYVWEAVHVFDPLIAEYYERLDAR